MENYSELDIQEPILEDSTIVESSTSLNEDHLHSSAMSKSIGTNMKTGQIIHPYAASFLTMDPEALQQHFPGLMGQIGDIRSATQTSTAAFTAFSGSSRSPTQSPVCEHPISQSSPLECYNSFLWRELSPPLPPEKLLLRNFVANLPIESPSPFKTTEIFWECPTQKRKLVERRVSLREPDDPRGHNRWVEMGLVYEEEPRYRAHCVLAGSSKVVLDNQEYSTVEGICTVWTRKYPEGWEGISMNEFGDLVDYPLPMCAIRDTNPKTGASRETATDNFIPWLYSTAVCVDVDGVETRMECSLLKKIIEFEGVTYDLEPGWEDIVNTLKEEFSAWAQRECSVEQQNLIESRYSPKNSIPKPSKQYPKKSKKNQQPMPSLKHTPPLQRAVAQTAEPPAASIKLEYMRKGENIIFAEKKSSTVNHRTGPSLDFHLTPQLHRHRGSVLPSQHLLTEAITIGSFETPSPDQVAVHHPNINFSRRASAYVEIQLGEVTPPAKETPKPEKRSRTLTKRKEIASKQFQDIPDQDSQAADAKTPLSTEKSGSKRKISTTPRTPAKKRCTANRSPVSEVRDVCYESLEVVQEVAPEKHIHGGPETASIPLGGFGTQQVTIGDPFQEDGLSRSAEQMSLPTWSNQMGQMTNQLYPSGFTYPQFVPYIEDAHSPMSGMCMGLASSGYISVSQQLQLLDQHQAALIGSFRNGRGVSEIHRVQHKLAELNTYRTRLLAVSCNNTMSANQLQICQPSKRYLQASQDPSIPATQRSKGPQLDCRHMSLLQQNTDQQLDYFPVSSMQSSKGSQHTTLQISGSQHNDDYLLSHSQLSGFQTYNQSPQISTSSSHTHQPSEHHQSSTAAASNESWTIPEVESLSQSSESECEARWATTYLVTGSMFNQATPYCDFSQRVANSSTSQPVNGRHSSTTQPSIAKYSHSSVQHARGYVTSLLQTPMDQLLQTPSEKHRMMMRQLHEGMQRQKSTEQCAEPEESNDPELGKA